jgi:hypothetical protein
MPENLNESGSGQQMAQALLGKLALNRAKEAKNMVKIFLLIL